MKVLIALVASSEHLSGVSRHAINVVRCLLSRAEVTEVHVAVAPWQTAAVRSTLDCTDPRLHLHEVPVTRGAIGRNAWYYFRLPRLARKLNADIVHLAYPAPLRRGACPCPTVVTLHDLYPYDIPANFGFPKMLFNRLFLQQCLRSADTIACVSDSTLQRLDMIVPRQVVQKASKIFNCVDPGPAMSAASPIPGWSDEPFVLCVAQHRRNKNILFAIRVFRRLLFEGLLLGTAKLVIVGIEGPETERIHQFIRESGLAPHIILLRGIDDAELAWCYGHCEFLLAPSLVEGFGLPIVEAMLHHTRVVCSDIAAFREVGGSYCYYAALEPNGEDAFVKAVQRARASFKFRESAVERFSSPRIAEAYIGMYTRLSQARAAGSSSNLVHSLERGRP